MCVFKMQCIHLNQTVNKVTKNELILIMKLHSHLCIKYIESHKAYPATLTPNQSPPLPTTSTSTTSSDTFLTISSHPPRGVWRVQLHTLLLWHVMGRVSPETAAGELVCHQVGDESTGMWRGRGLRMDPGKSAAWGLSSRVTIRAVLQTARHHRPQWQTVTLFSAASHTSIFHTYFGTEDSEAICRGHIWKSSFSIHICAKEDPKYPWSVQGFVVLGG